MIFSEDLLCLLGGTIRRNQNICSAKLICLYIRMAPTSVSQNPSLVGLNLLCESSFIMGVLILAFTLVTHAILAQWLNLVEAAF